MHEGESAMEGTTKRARSRRRDVEVPLFNDWQFLRLTDRERAFLKALRRFEEARAESISPPEALLEHGKMPLKTAATLIGKSVAEITGRDRSGRYISPHELVPVLRGELTVCSEALRAWKRAQADRLEDIGRAATECLNTRKGGNGKWAGVAVGPFWHLSLTGSSYAPPFLRWNSIEKISQRIGCSKAEAKRLMNGTLFCHVIDGRGTRFVTNEELDAYKRKLDREAAGQAKAVAA